MKYQCYLVIIMLSLIAFLGACSKQDQQEALSPSAPDDSPSVSMAQQIGNASDDPENPTVDASQMIGEPPKISIGEVKIISGGIEYEPRIYGLNALAKGIHYDAVVMQPSDIADLLETVPLSEDFQIIIDGGIRRGEISYMLYAQNDGEWVIISKDYGDPPDYSTSMLESGEYILCITLTWENGADGVDLEYLGEMYSFKISA